MRNGKLQNEQPIPVINTVIDTINNLIVSKDTVCQTDIHLAAKQKELPSTYSPACLL